MSRRARWGTALPWADQEAYTDLMLMRSIESFERHMPVCSHAPTSSQAPASHPIFADRGIPDTLAYARLIGLQDTRAIEGACRRYRYAPVVFLVPPWDEIYRTDSERKQDFAEAVRTSQCVADAYGELGYRIIEVPKLAPAMRGRFMLERI